MEVQNSALSSQGVFNRGTLFNINMAALHLKNKQRKYCIQLTRNKKNRKEEESREVGNHAI